MLKNCKDYEILKKYLNEDLLNEIDYMIKEYEEWLSTDESGDYTKSPMYYGNSHIIEWYEGLNDTYDFMIEFLEKKIEYMEDKMKVCAYGNEELYELGELNYMYERVIGGEL